MRARQLSRRALLAGGAAALTACSTSGPPRPAVPAPDSPETVLLKALIAEKERTIALYSSAVAKGSEKLAPFRDRHQAHLTELRKYVPKAATTAPTSGTPAPSPSASGKPSLSRLRELERKAAAQRPRQLDGVSPGVAQLIASIGACEAAHAVALPRSL
ncbi:hypothetical protein FAF44_16975 [Nonomuraea sp. MG754425]|uniref:hypothetical protein n=1 Tax=Nonomuraea sp. MG754425 TaxID=2570319 RepID=UPI001F242277|nr:hypothetical protein [Nonomuraea sp. MG754425]MCF6470076.1 hypothetical protein [Nonomuraea sp. MG754425]